MKTRQQSRIPETSAMENESESGTSEVVNSPDGATGGSSEINMEANRNPAGDLGTSTITELSSALSSILPRNEKVDFPTFAGSKDESVELFVAKVERCLKQGSLTEGQAIEKLYKNLTDSAKVFLTAFFPE